MEERHDPENILQWQDCCLFCYRPIPKDSAEIVRNRKGVFCNQNHEVKLAGYLYMCEEAIKEAAKYPKREVDLSRAHEYLTCALAESCAAV